MDEPPVDSNRQADESRAEQKNRSVFSLSAIAVFGLGSTVILDTLSSAAQAQTAKDLVGTWQHVANVNTAVDGKKTDAFGPNPKGMTIFLRRWAFHDHQSS
jgi:hypothetical protein